MPRPNVELIARLYDAFAVRDVETIIAILADDVVITQSTEVPWGGVHRGHDGAVHFFATLGANITSKVTVERLIDSGDHVVVLGWTRGTVNANGAPFDVPISHVWEVRDGKAKSVLFCIDTPTMRAALDAG